MGLLVDRRALQNEKKSISTKKNSTNTAKSRESSNAWNIHEKSLITKDLKRHKKWKKKLIRNAFEKSYQNNLFFFYDYENIIAVLLLPN